jgi:hypothetical protein
MKPSETDLRAVLQADAVDVCTPAELLARTPTASNARRTAAARRRGLSAVLAAGAAIVAISAGAVIVGRVTNHPPAAQNDISRWPIARPPHSDFTVRYPPSWHAKYFTAVSSFSTSLVYFTTQPLQNPCRTSDHGSTITCGSPTKRLVRNGLLISWERWGFPLRPGQNPLDRVEGQATLINGRPAKLAITAADSNCAHLGGATSINAAIRAANGFYRMEACLTGSRQSTQSAITLASLATATGT